MRSHTRVLPPRVWLPGRGRCARCAGPQYRAWVDAVEWSRRAQSFQHGVSEYERLRPDFPPELFDDVCASAGPRLQGRVLEIGAGTGRATLPLVRRGATIEVVEPSTEMLRILGARLEAEGLSPTCVLRQATFEDVDPGSTYAVVAAAQSFHWTDPATRWSRLASLIRAGGRAYLFWNGWHLASPAHDLDAVRLLYATHGGGLQPDLEDHRADGRWAEREIEAEPALKLVESRAYAWPWQLNVEDYLGLLMTTSQYAVAQAGIRDPLLGALRELLGDLVTLQGMTHLLIVDGGHAIDAPWHGARH